MDIDQILSRPAEEFGNDESLEKIWASKAFEHAELYFNLLISVDPKYLKLCPLDDVIYNMFRKQFPSLDVKAIDEASIKSDTEKIQWRLFCERFKSILEDYNFGTLLRCDCTEDYSEINSMLVPRVQFLAIELARNREGLNDGLRKKFRKTDAPVEVTSAR